MDRLFRALRPFIRRVTQRAGVVLGLAVLATALGGYGASQLSLDTNIANLVPEDYESVQALNTLQRTVGGERDMAVAITSPSFEANKQFAEALIPEALSLRRTGDTSETYLTRVEYKREVEFLRDNALYFASDQELRQVEGFLDDQIAEAKRARQDANPFYFELEEGEADTTETTEDGEALEGVYDRLVGTRYPVSDDSTTMVLRFYPSGSNTNIGYIEDLYADTRALVDRMDPASYHPEMKVVLAGRLYRQLAEVNTIWGDVAGSFGAGVGTVLLVVVLYFLYKAYRVRSGPGVDGRGLFWELVRAPVMGLVIGGPLFMSLAWTGGAAALLFGELNLMTSTLGLVLFGLGIDFGIHFYARYAEERADGHAVVDAVERTFVSTGQAIAVGAFTTAGALYVLVAADFKGFSEFGAIAGTGVLFALLAMTVVMPALLALLERTRLLNLRGGAGLEAREATHRRYAAARPVVVGGLVAVLGALVLAPRVDFQYDFGALEPEYTEYEQRDQYVDRVSTGGDGDRRNPAYVVADSAAEVPAIVEAVREKMRSDTTSPTILAVESLQERFPLHDTSQAAKLRRIAQIRETATENRYLRDESTDALERLRRAAQPRTPIPLDQVPRSLRKQFTTKEGELGQFVMIYPSVGLSDGRKSIAFARDVGTITTDDGTTYHAGSTSLVAADMLMLLQREAPWMILGTFVIVALLMLLNFRSLRWAGLALVPLGVGLLWMLLAMEVFGLRVNFYNMVVFPAILGIGNDAGVHMVHRYREEGSGSLWTVLRSTGEHVTMGTLTTMVGFGGLLLSFHPGLNSMGTLAVLGLGTTLLAAVAFLPALWQWLEDRGDVPHDVGTEEE
ncbi:efflux RND transporter permease subunit [Salinibacter altiplanensis]|uniref:efflux RND transporter permease subunit n=1 Tax=Salinibacter altiplanensis TaxID=1803181 RepID=UPI000C9ED33F|nr:MMPL family transporter [Salinibacter altiplanensis]